MTGNRRIVIHLGLQKTATRFMQKYVFTPTREQGVIYNPEPMMSALHALYRSPDNPDLLREAQSEIAHTLQMATDATLLISKPDLLGDMYNSYASFRENLDLLKRLFPEAELLLFIRHPADWLHSAYRQSLVKGVGGSIETFLNYYDGAFQPKRAHFANGMRNVDALSLPFKAAFDHSVALYGADSVHLYCFEDFRRDKPAVLEQIRRLLGLGELVVDDADRVKNRSFSALAIHIFCRGGVSRRRPRFSALPSPLWVRRWVQRPVRKIRAALIKHGFDHLIYRDWDLLARGGMREQLEDHYQADYDALRLESSKGLR